MQLCAFRASNVIVDAAFTEGEESAAVAKQTVTDQDKRQGD